ncbi:MAG TPA: SRPBCC family protein [Planctomycetota bacterium]|nr:SRPBCC family protein [Planctomycetota bacterium]
MTTIEEKIDVDVPVRAAYDQWTQFESFPEFMEGVKSVTQLDDQNLHWHAEVAGKDMEWTSRIVEQVPDQRISWASTSGKKVTGLVTFATVAPAKTRITLRMEVEPEGAAEKVGSAVGVLSLRVKGDLKRFKEFIEERHVPTGEWRGEIHGSQVNRPG